ncbi:MAG TPA: hypothetical protein DIC53_04735 [Synergistaceae bacterium]|nr:hypothetical protein [Synergistaceae bacterium]
MLNIHRGGGEIDLAEILSLLWGKRRLIVAVAVFFMLAGVAYAILTPRVYEARIALLILPPIPSEITGEQKASGASVFTPDIYIDLARARDLMQGVIMETLPKDNSRPNVEVFSDNFKITVNKSSETYTKDVQTPRASIAPLSLTLTATLRGRDRHILPALLSAWSDAFIKKNSQLFYGRAAQSFEYLQETLLVTKKNLEEAEDALFSYRKENPVSVLQIQLETMKSLHGEFLADYTRKLRGIAPLEAQIQLVRSLIESEPERKTLKRGMSKEALWNYLAQKLGPEELRQIEELDIMDEFLNTHYASLKAKLQEYEIGLTALKASIADLNNHIMSTEKEYETKQSRLLQIGLDMERLTRTETVLQGAYDVLAQKYQASKIAVADAADSIRVIEHPVMPERPVAPQRKLIVVLSSVIGVFAGLFAGFVSCYVENYEKRAPAES